MVAGGWRTSLSTSPTTVPPPSGPPPGNPIRLRRFMLCFDRFWSARVEFAGLFSDAGFCHCGPTTDGFCALPPGTPNQLAASLGMPKPTCCQPWVCPVLSPVLHLSLLPASRPCPCLPSAPCITRPLSVCVCVCCVVYMSWRADLLGVVRGGPAALRRVPVSLVLCSVSVLYVLTWGVAKLV